MTQVEGQRYKILFSKPIAKDKIKIHWRPLQQSLPTQLQNRIQAYWTQVGEKHFNGQLARLDHWCFQGSELKLALSITDYQTLIYSNAHINIIQTVWGESCWSRALGVSAVVITADHYILYMQRSNGVGEYPGCFDIFGGHIDVSEKMTDAPDVFGAIKQELHEELGLPKETSSCSCIGLIEVEENKKPELIFKTQCPFTKDRIKALARSAVDRSEYVELFFQSDSKSGLAALIETEGHRFSPSAVAGLQLYFNQKQGQNSG